MSLTVLKSLKKQPSIKNLIHSSVAGWEKARFDGVVHASDLGKELEFCPREWALQIVHGIKPKDQFVGTALRMTFAHGRNVERDLRNEWLAGYVVGYWKCRTCGHNHPTFGKHPKVKCPKCAYTFWEYAETSFKSPHTGVSGSLDIIVDVGLPKHRIVEVKTMDKDQFKDLKAPLAEHKARTSLYMRLAHESHLDEADSINTNQAHILYVSKSFGFQDKTLAEAGIKDAPFSPFKEFMVERDDSLTDNVLNRARVVHLFRQDQNIGMPCGVCVNGLEKRAQHCSAVKYCWNGSHPSIVTWKENGVVRHPAKKCVE